MVFIKIILTIAVLNFSVEGNANFVENRKWPNNTVIYNFSNRINEDYRKIILSAFEYVQSATCVTFKQWSNETFFMQIIVSMLALASFAK